MNKSYLNTGSPRIDGLLKDGVPRGDITHFFGENGSGKTTICLMTASKALGENQYCFFLTPKKFPIERFKQISEPEIGYIDNLFVFESMSHRDQKEAIFGLEKNIEEVVGEVELVVVDDLTNYYSPGSVDEEERFKLKKELANQLIKLVGLSRRYSFCVLVTNQVYEDIESGEKKPRGGRLVTDISALNVELKKTRAKRGLATLREPGVGSVNSVAYRIDRSGLV